MFPKLMIRLLVMLITCMTQVHAQQPGGPEKIVPQLAAKLSSNAEPLEVKLVRKKVVLVDGKESLQSAAIAKPGDILEEVATYANKTRLPLRNLEATLPIPLNTVLELASVKPGNAKASVDGAEFFILPLKRKVKQANGNETEQAIPVSEYRYLRWYPGDLAAEKALIFSARFKVVNDNTNENTLAITPAIN